MSVAVAPVTRICRRCGGEFGYEQLAKLKRAPDGVQALCLDCERRRKRRIEHGLGDQGWVTFAPDRRPAVRLRQELARDRRLGLAFDEIWLEDVELILRSVPYDERTTWRAAFLATEQAWRAGYERANIGAVLSLELVA